MKKKICALFCVIVLMFTMSTAAFAAPRLKYFSSVFADISMDSSGHAVYTGNYTVDTEHTVRLTVTLQKSKDGKTWSNVSGESESETFTARGTRGVAGTSSSAMTRAYNYRTKAVATVLDSNGKTLEQVTVYSLAQPYSLLLETGERTMVIKIQEDEFPNA